MAVMLLGYSLVPCQNYCHKTSYLLQIHHQEVEAGPQKYRPFSDKHNFQLLNTNQELSNNYYQAHLLSPSSPVPPLLCPIIAAAYLRYEPTCSGVGKVISAQCDKI
jgi:hypothetical protein